MNTLIGIIQDHIVWRHQLLKLAKADIVKTYSGAALGWAWAIIKPTVMVLVLWFAFSVGLRVNSEVNGYGLIKELCRRYRTFYRGRKRIWQKK